jgi:hypothetical protein
VLHGTGGKPLGHWPGDELLSLVNLSNRAAPSEDAGELLKDFEGLPLLGVRRFFFFTRPRTRERERCSLKNKRTRESSVQTYVSVIRCTSKLNR